MTQPTVIYSQADIAKALRVSRPAVANYFQRYDNTPLPAYVTPEGLRYWDVDGFEAWQTWRKNTIINDRRVTP